MRLLFYSVLVLGSLWGQASGAGQVLQFNCHKLYRFYPTQPDHIKYLVDLKSSSEGIIFWTPVNVIGQYTDILFPPELLHVVNTILSKGIPGQEYFNRIQITFGNAPDSTLGGACPARPIVKPPAPETWVKISTNSLFTISLKSRPGSILTYSSLPSQSGGYFLELLTRPGPAYAPGGASFETALWRFVPIPQNPGYYVLSNKVLGGLSTFIPNPTAGNKQLVLTTDPKKNAGLPMDRVLWRVIPSSIPGSFKLKIKSQPYGYVTWGQELPTGLLMQIDELPSNLPKYESGGAWEGEVSFTFVAYDTIQGPDIPITDPVTEGPIIVEPVTQGPIVVEPVTQGPIVVEPVTQGPIVVEPVTVGPIVVEPVTVGPIVVDPVTVGPIDIDPIVTPGPDPTGGDDEEDETILPPPDPLEPTPVPLVLGAFYQITLKKFTDSILSYAPDSTLPGGNPFTVVLQDLRRYAPGGDQFLTTLWRLSVTEEPGYYFLENYGILDTIGGYTVGTPPSKNYLQFITDPVEQSKYQKPGPDRNRLFIRVQPAADQPGYYTIQFKGSDGYVTWATVPNADVGYKYLYLDGEPSTLVNYQPNGPNRLDVLFGFKQIALTITEIQTRTPVISGTYYQFTIKKFPGSIFTYTKGTDGTYLGNIATTQLTGYQPGGYWFMDGVWRLTLVEPGYYIIENKGQGGILVFTGTAPGKNYLQVITDRTGYETAGPKRDSALFSITQAPETGYYVIIHKGTSGYVTWANGVGGKTPNGYFALVDTANKGFYQVGGMWREYVLFGLSQLTQVNQGTGPLLPKIYYRLQSKTNPNSFLVPGGNSTSGGKLVIASDSTDTQYNFGGWSFMDSLWRLYSEGDGYYVFENKVASPGVLSYVPGTDNYLELINTSGQAGFQIGGEKRDGVLILIKRAAEPGYFTLQIKSSQGYLVVQTDKTTGGYVVKVDASPANQPFYQVGGKYRDFVLFSFGSVPDVKPSTGPILPNLYYRLSVKSSPTSVLSYTKKEAPFGGSFLQLATSGLDKFSVDGAWYNDTLWYFKATEVPGYYIISNLGSGLGFPASYLTSPTKSGSQLLYLPNNPGELQSFGLSGQYRDRVLVSIRKAVGPGILPGYFTLNFRDLGDGLISQSSELSYSGKYVQTDNSLATTQGLWKANSSSVDDYLFTISTAVQTEVEPVVTTQISGGYYVIKIKSKPSVLTYTRTETSFGGRFLQLATSNLPTFAQTGPYFTDSVWQITESEVQGFYTFVNLGDPNGILTSYLKFSVGNSPKYLILSGNPEEQKEFGPGGSQRDKVLFKLTKAQGPGFVFTIQAKSYPLGFVTFLPEKSPFGTFVQVDDAVENQAGYLPTGKNRDDVLFEFTRIESSVIVPVTTPKPVVDPTDVTPTATPPPIIVEPEPATELRTDTYYVISLKSKPDSRLGYVDPTVETVGLKLFQLITSGLEQYAPAQPLYTQILWRFHPTEIPGYYTLENRAIPNGLGTFSVKDGFQYLVVNSDAQDAKTFVPEAPLRGRVLWSIHPSEVKGYYYFRILGLPNGFITWKNEHTTDGFYLMGDTRSYNKVMYEVGGKWREDILFKFMPADSTLQDTEVVPAPITVPPSVVTPDPDEGFVKIGPIPTAPTLFTGIIYRLSLKSEPNSVLAYLPDATKFGGLYFHLVTQGVEAYLPEGPSYNTTLWYIAGTEVEGYYTLNQLSTGGIATSYSTYWSGKYNVIITDPGTKKPYQFGGATRDLALWQIQGSEVPGYYTFTMKAFPTAVVTQKKEKIGGGVYIYPIEKDLESYAVGGPSRDNALFSVLPAISNYIVNGKVSYFKYEFPPRSTWDLPTNVVQLQDITTANPGSEDATVTLQHTDERRSTNRFVYTFNESFPLLTRTTIIGGIDGSVVPNVVLTANRGIIAGEPITLESTYDYNTAIEVKVPAHSSVTLSASYHVVNLEIPFTAILEITSGALRPTLDGSAQAVLVSGNSVVGWLKTKSSGADVIGVKGTSVFVRLTGTIKTTFATPIQAVNKVTPLVPIVPTPNNQTTGGEDINGGEILPPDDTSIPPETDPSLLTEDGYEPIVRIPDTNLFSGLFYLVSLKSQLSFLTFTRNRTMGGGNYVQLATLPERLPNYAPSGPWYQYGQFRFTSSEVAGYTIIRNRKSVGYVVVGQDASTDGKLLELTRAQSANVLYVLGGRFRSNAIWSLLPTPDQAYFQIRPQSFPGALVTTDLKRPSHSGSLIQLDVIETHVPDFSPNGLRYDDSLFTILPANLKFHAKVFNFAYQVPAKDLVRTQHLTRVALISNISLSNPTPAILKFKLQVSHPAASAAADTNVLLYEFNENLSFLTDYELQTELRINNHANIERTFSGGFGSGQTIRIEEAVDWSFTTTLPDVQVPAYKAVNVSYFYSSIRNVVTTFRAEVEIKGITDRVALNGNIVPGAPLSSPEFIMEYLRAQGVKDIRKSESGTVIVGISGAVDASYVIPAKDFTVNEKEPKDCEDVNLPVVTTTTPRPVITTTTTMAPTTTTTTTTPRPTTTTRRTTTTKKAVWQDEWMEA